MTEDADVTVLMPAYKAAGFISTAIESVLAQTYPRLRLLISVDPAGDETETVCRRFETDPRVTVRVNPERLGWVGNVNACLDSVDTDYTMFVFHDDHIAPGCIARLRGALSSRPDAVSAVPFFRAEGSRSHRVPPVPDEGSPFARAAARIAGSNLEAYGLKTMVRSHRRLGLSGLPDLPLGGYNADWPVMVEMALRGGHVPVPEATYVKTYWDGSVSDTWRYLDEDSMVAAETANRAAIIDVLRRSDAVTDAERRALIQLVLERQTMTDLELGADTLFDHLELRPHRIAAALLADGSDPADARVAELPDNVARHVARKRLRSSRAALAAGDLYLAHAEARRALAVCEALADGHALAAHCVRLIAKSGLSGQRHHLERSAELAPDKWQTWMTLGWARLHQGDRAGAREAAEHARALAPLDAEPLARLFAQFDRG